MILEYNFYNNNNISYYNYKLDNTKNPSNMTR